MAERELVRAGEYDKENKKINFDFDDEIINSGVLTHNGDLRLEQFS